MIVQVPGCMFTFLAEFLEERSTVIVSHFWLQLTFFIMFCYFCKVVVYDNIIVSSILFGIVSTVFSRHKWALPVFGI